VPQKNKANILRMTIINQVWQRFQKKDWISKFEVLLILLFFLGGIGWGAYQLSSTPESESLPDPSIRVFAYSMPNRGWAPLLVYFSPFGTTDDQDSIKKYEWDLDGNGSFETDATANHGYASYVFSKPREYTISLRVTYKSGEIGVAQTKVTVKHPASSSVDYWSVFDDSQVRKIEIQITQSNWDLMMQNPWEKRMVQTDAVIFGEKLENIGISPKGNSTIGFEAKIPLKLDMNAFHPDQEYKNLKMLLLHNNFGDPSLLREKMAYDMMLFAGVSAGHTSFVEVWVDIIDDTLPADFLGVYTMVERPDTKYLANRFGRENDRGNLYKADAWFEEGAADLAYYGEDIENYPKPRGELAYALMYKDQEEADYADIIELCYQIDGVEYSSPDEFAAALEGVFNVDAYLRYLAVIFLTLNFDQYPDTGNNYYIYHNPENDLFEWIAWDMGNSWGHFGGSYDHPVFGTEHSLGPLQYRPLFTKVFEVEEYRQTYLAYMDLLVRNYFNEQQISRSAQDWATLIRPHIEAGSGDKMFFGSSAVTSLEGFDDAVQTIIELSANRAGFVADYINQSNDK
jgi:spore coat protein CotH